MWGDIQDIFLFGCPKTIDITGFFKKFCIATRTKAATKELDSALAQLDQPGDYYWVTVFSKADGSAFLPDGQTEVRSDRRIKEESFHAVRITTTTYKWSSAGGAIHDVAHIEGTLPGDAIIGFELHDYETGDKVADAEDSTLSDMDGYVEDAKEQTVTSPAVTVPDAGDHYFVEWVRIPGDDQGEPDEPGPEEEQGPLALQVFAAHCLELSILKCLYLELRHLCVDY